MRTTRTISISLPPKQLKAAERLARKENRTMSELVREALRRYEQSALPHPQTFAEALALLREDAHRKGADKLTPREINREIDAARRERSGKLKSPAA